mgnify:CR=1 FL=1
MKLFEKLEKKACVALGALLAAAIAILWEEIDKYFQKKKYYEKGIKDAQKLYEEQEILWKKRIEQLQNSFNKTIRERMKMFKQLKKEFQQYKKANPIIKN